MHSIFYYIKINPNTIFFRSVLDYYYFYYIIRNKKKLLKE